MYRFSTLFFVILGLLCSSCAVHQKVGKPEHTAALISRIAFGSCGNPRKPEPVLDLAAVQKPDLFIWLGDNVYADTESADSLERRYRELDARPEYQRLKKTCPFVATWDDHDYGWNDVGRHYPLKEASKEIFLNFFDVPKDDIRRTREGIYTSYIYTDAGHTVQVIVLDMRTFRDDLRPYRGEKIDTSRYNYELDYWPHDTADSTLLGEKQWKWLEKQLEQPADLRIIASSSQFGITYNGYEAWANFPNEVARMQSIIQKTQADGVVFISGDVHYAELSKLTCPKTYPLYDLTASGITSTWGFATPNDNRIEGPVMENHFGMLEIDWAKNTLLFKIIDVAGKTRINRQIKLSEICFGELD